jgi:cytoskeletal protein CcmA (bactofilin family)
MTTPTNVLSSGIEITGSVRFTNDMIVDGKIEGEISSDKGRLTIGENASIKGDISAGEVKVYGKIEGKITAQRCELNNKSRINGDIKSKVFSMEEGAQLSGRTEIGGGSLSAACLPIITPPSVPANARMTGARDGKSPFRRGSTNRQPSPLPASPDCAPLQR